MSQHILAGLAALAALTQAHAWLLDAPAVEAQPGLRRTTQPREMTTRQGKTRDALLSLERAERRVTDIPTTPHPVPVRPALLDAQAAIHDAAVDAAWITASGLRRRPLVVVHHVARATWADPWAAAVFQLRVGLPWLVCDCPETLIRTMQKPDNGHRGGCLDRVAEQVATILTTADVRARTVLGIGPSWVSLALACEDCRRRTVEAEVSSQDERDWIARCGNGCWIRHVQDDPRARLADSAVLRSIRRNYQQRAKRERIAA